MNCSENKKFYIDIFLESLKVDDRVLSFDYMIEGLLEADLSDDQLLMAISIYKGLYESLLHIDRMSHNKSTIDMVSRSINSVNESVKLLKKQPTQSIYAKNIVNKIREYFNYKPKDSIRTQIETITEKFNNKNLLTDNNIIKLAELYKELKSTVINNEEQLQALNLEIEKIREKIGVKVGTKRASKALGLFDNVFNYKDESSKYIDLGTINGIEYYGFENDDVRPVAWILTKDMKVLYAVVEYDKNNKKRYRELRYENGTPILSQNYISDNVIRNAYIKHPQKTNEERFNPDRETVETSKRVRADQRTILEPDVVSDDLVVRFINKVEDENNLIRNNANAKALYRIRKGIDPLVNVQLVKISESNRERNDYVSRIVNGRTVETFETPEQREYLKNNPDRVVLTVGRFEDDYAVIGRSQEGHLVSLYAPNNYVFVYGDNRTVKVDFNNEEHLDLFEKLGIKRVYTEEGTEFQKLTRSDILKLRNANNVYYSMLDEASKLFEGVEANNADITRIFKDYYIFKNKKKVLTTLRQREHEAPKGKHYSLVLNIVEVEEKNNEFVKKKNLGQRSIPFVLEWNNLTGRRSVINFLNPEERIEINGELYTMPQYFNNFIKALDKGKEIDAIKYISDLAEKHGSLKTFPILVLFENLKDHENNIIEDSLYAYAYRIIEYEGNAKMPFNIGYTIANLYNVLTKENKEDRKTILEDIGKNKFSFTPIFNSENKGLFNLYLTTDSLGNIVLQFASYKNGKYEEFFNKVKNRYEATHFILNQNSLKSLFNKIVNSKEYKAILDSGAVILIDGMNEADKAISVIKHAMKNIHSMESIAFKSFLNTLNNDLMQLFQDSVIDKIKNPKTFKNSEINELHKEFIGIIKNEFTLNNKVFKPEYTIIREIPNVENGYELKLNFKENEFNVPKLDRLKILEELNFSQVKDYGSILAVGTPITMPIEEKIINNSKTHKEITESSKKKEIKNVKQVETKKETKQEDKKIEVQKTKEETGSIWDEVDDSKHPFFELLSNQQFADKAQQEIENKWIRENLGIDFNEFEGLNINNNIVLGYVKDRMLYLNSQMRGIGTGYHEGFHYVFNYIFDPITKRNVLDEIINNKKYKDKFTKENINKFRKKRNYNVSLSDEQIIDIIAEEILADQFKDFALRKQKETSKEKTLIQKVLDFLKKLLDMFIRKSSEIDILFNDIYTGKYKNYTTNKYSDSIIKYELIPTIQTIYLDNVTNKYRATPYYLSSQEQAALVNMTVSYMLRDNINDNFDDKFKNASKYMLENIWSINSLYALNDAIDDNTRKKIRDSYSSRVSAYRFLLGDRLTDNVESFDNNITGDERFNNQIKPGYKLELPNGEVVENLKGEYSIQQFKNLVKEEYDKSDTLKDFVEVIEDYENELIKEEEDENLDNIGDRFDEGMSEYNVTKQNVGLIRRFLSTIIYEKIDKATGLKIPATADPMQTFYSIVQATANLSSENILPSLLRYSEIIREDGYINESNVIKAVYDSLIDEDNNVKHNQIYNLFQNVFENIELGYLMFNVNKNVIYDGPYEYVDYFYSLKNTLLESDITFTRKRLYDNFNRIYSKNKNKEEYKKSINELKRMINTYFLSKLDNKLFDILSVKSIDNISKEMSDLFKAIGINFNKSLIKLSLLAHINEHYNNEYKEHISKEDKDFLNSFNDFIQEKQYLTDFSIKSFYNTFLGNDYLLNEKSISDIILPDDGKVPKPFKAFDAQLRSALIFVFRYHPHNRPSMVRNAEGQPIYRYIKPNPLSKLILDIRRNGLAEALKKDELWDNFFKDYAETSPLFGKYIKWKQNPESIELTDNDKKRFLEYDLYFENLSIDIYGGVIQSENYEKYKEGKHMVL